MRNINAPLDVCKEIKYKIKNLKRDLLHIDDVKKKGKLVSELLDEIQILAENAVRTEEYNSELNFRN